MTQEISNINGIKQEDKDKTSPPYIPFTTFSNFITWIESEGIPIKFDRSFWGKKFAGSTGTQLSAGLRFLGLLQGEFTQPALEGIIKAKGDDRKHILANTIRKSYSGVDFTVLDRATPSMLNEWFDKYGLDGSTERKAISFFINACKAYDVALSNALKKKARNKQPGYTRSKRAESGTGGSENRGDGTEKPPSTGKTTERLIINPPAANSSSGYSETVTLPGDIGTITISVSLNPIKLKGKSRDWFNQLIDKLGECPTE